MSELLACTPREWDVLVELCTDGSDNETIARRLQISRDTVNTHVRAMMRKANLPSRTALALAVVKWDIALAVKIPVRAL